jgi:hypothetical protein
MQVEHTSRTGSFVEVIHVLRDDIDLETPLEG